MYEFSPYFMLISTTSALVLSLLFLFLSAQGGKRYMQFWGMACIGYTFMFFLDFMNFQFAFGNMLYLVMRQMIALIGSSLFFLGTCELFERKVPPFLHLVTMTFLLLTSLESASELFYDVLLIPNVLYCSSLLVGAGCLFMLNARGHSAGEYMVTGFTVLLWSIFINHFGFSIENIYRILFTYTCGIVIVSVLILLLITMDFRQTGYRMKKQYERFRMLVENSYDTLFLYDYRTQKFSYVSEKIEELIGVSSEALYENPELFYSGAELESEALSTIFAEPVRGFGHGNLKYAAPDGSVVYSVMHYVPIVSSIGSVYAVEGVMRDITENVKMERQIRRNEKMRKEILENIAHEIKTPVTLLMGYAETLSSGIVSGAASGTYFEMLRSKASMLATLVDDLTNATNPRSQSMEYRFYEQTAESLFRTLTDQCRDQIERAGRIAEIITEWNPAVILVADAYRIQQVVSNLVNNALKHTEEGKKITISCRTTPYSCGNQLRDESPALSESRQDCDLSEFSLSEKNHLCGEKAQEQVSARISGFSQMYEDEDDVIPSGIFVFCVSDEGTGIADKDLPHIFERRYSEGRREASSKDDGEKDDKGRISGLGLAISMQIVKSHGGTIYARNNESGVGASVTFELPYYRGE